ncbi:hypothetical protein H0H93_013574, partial [Arthromyces matolae]
IGLRPLDSVTNASDEGGDDTSDEEDAHDDEEDLKTRPEFKAWMKRWIEDVGVGADHHEAPLELDECHNISTTGVPPLVPSDDDSDESDRASPSIITTVNDVNSGARTTQDPPTKLMLGASRRTRTVSAMSVDSATYR